MSSEKASIPRLYANWTAVWQSKEEFYIELALAYPGGKEAIAGIYLTPEDAKTLAKELELMIDEFEKKHRKIPEPTLQRMTPPEEEREKGYESSVNPLAK